MKRQHGQERANTPNKYKWREEINLQGFPTPLAENPKHLGSSFSISSKYEIGRSVQLCLSFLDTFGGTVGIPRVSPPITPSNYLAGRRQLIVSNPGLPPPCHACAECRGAVVARNNPQPRAVLEAMVSLPPAVWQACVLCLTSGCQANACACRAEVIPEGRRRWPRQEYQWGRAQHCPKMKPRSMLEQGKAPSGHPAPRT